MHDSDDTIEGPVFDRTLFARLLGYLSPYRSRVVAAVGLVVIASILQLGGPLLTAAALDAVVDSAADPTELGGWLRQRIASGEWQVGSVLAWVGLSYMALLLITFVVQFVQGWMMQNLGQRVLSDLRREIFGQLQRLEVGFFDRNPVGRLVTRVTNDVDALNELFTSGVVAIFGDLALLGGIIAVLAWMDWRLALVTIAVLPALAALTLWFRLRARDSYRDVRSRLARINTFLQEHIIGMSVVQLFTAETRTAIDFTDINDAHRKANVRAIFYYAVYYPAVELMTAIGVGLILWYGGRLAAAEVLSLGALVAFLQYAQRFYRPLSDLAEKYNILQAAMAASERIFTLLDRQPAIVSPPDAAPRRVEGTIEFRDVEFSYLPDEPVLKGVSFRIEPGEVIAVVGHTGAGKSTLANLILRFYDVDSGAVLVDGVDVREWHLQSLRGACALVLQDVFLFSRSVAENIHLGKQIVDPLPLIEGEGTTESDLEVTALRQAAADAQILQTIEDLPQGFETQVRERGAGFSVGQKQLLSFARALATDPRILILDEATSSVDPTTEDAIQAALDRLLVGRTSIVIAHRLSTIRRADRVLVLHHGCLREQGTHRELLAADGIYARLIRTAPIVRIRRLQQRERPRAQRFAPIYWLVEPNRLALLATPTTSESSCSWLARAVRAKPAGATRLVNSSDSSRASRFCPRRLGSPPPG